MVNKMYDWGRRKLINRKARRSLLNLWTMQDIALGYVAIPKAASGSITKMIMKRENHRRFPLDYQYSGKLKNRVEKYVKQSITPRQGWELSKKYYLFTFVRNPLTRLYSCYKDKVVKAENKRKKCVFSPFGIYFGMTFEDFVQKVVEIPDEQSDQHFRSQYTFLMYKNEFFIHYWGRVESIEEDWEPLFQKYNLPMNLSKKRFTGPSLHIEQLPLSSRMTDLAINRYWNDIKLFGYHSEN